MTEKAKISKRSEAFVLKWAEAVSGLGLTRSAGRLHGLLLVSEQSLEADEMAAALGVARSNISMSLRDLLAMGLVEPVPEIGKRRTSYQAISAPETVAAAVFAHQKARLFDPIRDALADAPNAAGERLSGLSAYAATVDQWLADTSGPTAGTKPKKKKKKKG